MRALIATRSHHDALSSRRERRRASERLNRWNGTEGNEAAQESAARSGAGKRRSERALVGRVELKRGLRLTRRAGVQGDVVVAALTAETRAVRRNVECDLIGCRRLTHIRDTKRVTASAAAPGAASAAGSAVPAFARGQDGHIRVRRP